MIGKPCMLISRGLILLAEHSHEHVTACKWAPESLDLAPSRQMQKPELNDVPPELATVWAQAIKSNARHIKTALFQKFLSCGKDWGKWPVMNLTMAHIPALNLLTYTKHPFLRLHVRQLRSRSDVNRDKKKRSQHLRHDSECMFT